MKPGMTAEELEAAYALSARPFVEAPSAVNWEELIHLRAWRYVLEISSACNLHCTLCHAGNREGYQYTPGTMNPELFEKILDKIALENPKAIVCAYVNSEPFLHPRLAECIASIKGRGLSCEIATNLNYMRNAEAVLDARPDLFTVSVSGFTQPVYERAHRGGNIDVVKQNLHELAEIVQRIKYDGFVGISYHMYNDNMGEEMAQMTQLAVSLGFRFLTSWGRVITMENTVQALRHLEEQQTGQKRPYDLSPDGLDLNTMLPPANPEFIKGMERLHFHPAKAREFYARWPVAPVCVIADVFTEIRHDGRVQLCAWTDDTRLTLGNYLEMSQEEIVAARRGHPLCRECLRYRTNLYFHIVDRLRWDDMSS